MKLYSMFDCVAQSYSSPFGSKNDATATRELKRFCQVNRFDFSEFRLYNVGSFDDSTGVIIPSMELIAVNADIVDDDNQ